MCVLQGKIAAAKDELGGLNAEWAACVEEERRIIMAEESEGVESTKMDEAFGKEIDDIVRAKTDDVEKMDKVSIFVFLGMQLANECRNIVTCCGRSRIR